MMAWRLAASDIWDSREDMPHPAVEMTFLCHALCGRKAGMMVVL